MKKEAVLITAVPDAVKREGLILPFYGPDRKPKPVPIYPKPGDLIYGITYRGRQVLYQRGMAVPVIFDDEPSEVKPRKPMKPKLTRLQKEERKKKQKSLFDFLGGGGR